MNECSCINGFTPKLVPCPDGIEGCCVAHYDDQSWICPKCGHDYREELRLAWLSGNVHEEIGMTILNTKGLSEVTDEKT